MKITGRLVYQRENGSDANSMSPRLLSYPAIALKDCLLPAGPGSGFLGVSLAPAPHLSSIWIILTSSEKQNTSA